MKIKLKTDNPAQKALLQAIGSHDFDESRDAMKIFAKLVGEVAQQVLPESNVIDSFYDQLELSEFDHKEIPLDMFHDVDSPDQVRVTYATKPGDLSTSLLTGSDSFPLQFFNVQGGISFFKKYLRAGQLNYAEKGLERLLAEVIYKMKIQGSQPILQSIAQAQTDSKYHVIRSQTAGQLILKDFNRLKTLSSRINVSGLGGTTTSPRGINTLVMSPEMVEEIRGMAYEPMNTRGVPNSDESTAIAAPNSVREAVYNSAGNPSIYNTDIIEINELGVGYQFNTLFDAFAGSITYANNGEAVDSASRSVFDGTAEELIIGLALDGGTANGLIKAGIKDNQSSKVFNVRPDSQFMEREDKIGMYGTAELSYLSVEPRSLYGLIV